MYTKIFWRAYRSLNISRMKCRLTIRAIDEEGSAEF